MITAERYYTSGEYWENFADEDSSYKVGLLLSALRKSRIAFPEGFRGIEIGCGNGAFLIPLERALSKSLKEFKLDGYDISSRAIAMARNRMGNEQSQHLDFKIGSTSDVPAVDGIFLMDVVEHVENPYRFLRDLHGKGRYLFLHLPLEASLFHTVLRRPTRSYETFRHLHFFSWESARITFQECGFKAIGYQFTGASREGLGIYGSPATKAMRSLRFLAYHFLPNTTALLAGGSVMVILEPFEPGQGDGAHG